MRKTNAYSACIWVHTLTAIFLMVFVGMLSSSVSWQAYGLTRHDALCSGANTIISHQSTQSERNKLFLAMCTATVPLRGCGPELPPSIMHHAPCSKHQAPSTKHQASSIKHWLVKLAYYIEWKEHNSLWIWSKCKKTCPYVHINKLISPDAFESVVEACLIAGNACVDLLLLVLHCLQNKHGIRKERTLHRGDSIKNEHELTCWIFGRVHVEVNDLHF